MTDEPTTTGPLPTSSDQTGAGGRITVDEIELRRIELPLVTPFQTSFGTWSYRDILIARVTATAPDGRMVEGWGECTAGTQPLYSSEYTAGCEAVTVEHLLPRLFVAGVGTGAAVGPALADVQGHRMAKATLEAAVLDAELRAVGVSLADRLAARSAGTVGIDGSSAPEDAVGTGPMRATRVAVGVSIGILPTIDELVATAARHLDEGYARIKVKIKPGWDVEPLRRLRAELGGDFGLQVDANAAYRPSDIDHLRRLDEFDLLLIEQPFPEEMLVDNVALVDAVATPICLDESIVNQAVAVDAIALGATSVVNIKPGRVGGHLAGQAIHDLCLAAAVPVWHGGMLETGIGRAANLALAALPGFTLPGDISAADRYWHRDVVTEPAVLDADGMISVPVGPGIGVDVDVDFLDSVTRSSQVFRHPAN